MDVEILKDGEWIKFKAEVVEKGYKEMTIVFPDPMGTVLEEDRGDLKFRINGRECRRAIPKERINDMMTVIVLL